MSRPPIPADRRVRWGGGPWRHGDLRLPRRDDRTAPPHPVAVLLHGGCWQDIADATYLGALAAELTAVGWATWNLEYRTLGRGGGWPDTFLDVADGVDHLGELAAEHRLDLSRVVAVGHSAGGHLALWLAGRRRLPPESPLHRPDPLPLAGVVGLAAITDLAAFHALPRRGCGDAVARLLGGDPGAAPDRLAAASPGALLPLGVPQLLVTGEADEDVPPPHGEAWAARARTAGDDARHEVLADVGHFEVVAPWSPRWPGVRDVLVPFLERVAVRTG